nr:hypothetical protein BCU58_02975 [Vibrio sp. 10N.286.48.B7]
MNTSENSPCIYLRHTTPSLHNRWLPILHGIEEESIPVTVTQKGKDELDANASEAAHLSALGVGIACDELTVVLHQKNLKKHQPLFRITTSETCNYHQLKTLGHNAARLVKGLPFK